MKTSLPFVLLLLLLAPACANAQEGIAVTSSTTNTTTKVHWHKSLADAVAAAEKTGKPVLHFQLLGELDQEFC